MKNLLRGLLISVLALTMVLPFSFAVSAAEGDDAPVLGYTLAEGGYTSNWVGSQIATANWSGTYGAWVATDGQHNGCVQWTSGSRENVQKVKLDPETGVLTFPDGNTYNCKIYPAQTQTPIGKGGVFFSLDLMYTPPSLTDEEGFNSNFPGVVLTDKTGNGDTNLLCITNQGEVYESRYNMGSSFNQLVEGWNTLLFYILPYENDEGVVCNKVYFAINNSVNVIPHTLGITQEDLDNNYYQYSFNRGGKYFSELGSMFFLQAFQPDEKSKVDNLSIRNVVIRNLVSTSGTTLPSPNENLYKLTYADYNMTAYVPAAGGTLTIAPGAGVQYWKSGEGDDLKFYKPGDTFFLKEHLTISCATDSDLDYAELIAAYSKIDVNSLDTYTYAQIKAVHDEIVTCQETLKTKLPDTAESSSYYQMSETIRGQLDARMTQIANRAWELIDAAAIFDDYTLPLEDRMTAFEEVMDGEYDGTFSTECQRAISALGSFNATYEAIYEDWQQFLRGMQQLVNADESTERGTLILGMMENLSVIRRAGINNFTFDQDLVKAEYSNHMDAQLAYFEELESMADMYAFLLEWFSEYNAYKKVMFGERKRVDVPEQLQIAVDTYNEYVSTINDQMLNATTVAGALQYNTVKQAVMRDLVADVIDKKDSLFYEEEEEE